MSVGAATRAPQRAPGASLHRRGPRSDIVGWLFITPNVVGFALFIGLPMLAGFVISLTQWDMLTPPRWVGLGNYIAMVHDPLMWLSLRNTLYYAILTIPGSIVVSLALAVAANRVSLMFKSYRLLFFIPVVSSTVAISLMWKWVYNEQFGILNWLLTSLGMPRVGWLTTPAIAMPAIALVAIWKTMGYYMVLFLAGLQGIPGHLYESARIDGANAWRQFWNITLPLLSPTMFFVLIISVIGSFQVFDQVYVMTQGGPGNSTLVYNYYLWQNAFQYFKMGYASALAYGLFILIFVITLIQAKVMNKRVVYDVG